MTSPGNRALHGSGKLALAGAVFFALTTPGRLSYTALSPPASSWRKGFRRLWRRRRTCTGEVNRYRLIFSITPELQRLRLYYANMRAIRHVAPSLKPQRLIEFCRLVTLRSEAKQNKPAFSCRNNGLYEPAPDAESAETGKDVEVTDSAYSSIPGVWIDVQAADTDQRASGASGEDGLAGFAEVISARGPIIRKSAQKLPAGLFAFGE